MEPRRLKFLVMLFAIGFSLHVYLWRMGLSRSLGRPGYEYAAYALFGLGAILIFHKRYLPLMLPIYPLFFMPVWIMPLIRCWFPIPYVFCHGCHNKCAWGIYRAAFVPGFIGINLDSRLWCWSMCPLGHIQASMIKHPARRIPKALTYLRIPIMLAILAAVAFGFSPNTDPVFSPTVIGAAIIFVLILPSRRYNRPFCSILCPIGLIGDMTSYFRVRIRLKGG